MEGISSVVAIISTSASRFKYLLRHILVTAHKAALAAEMVG